MEETDKVRKWLESFNMLQHYDAFLELGYNSLYVCSELNNEDLDHLGITKPGERKTFLLYSKLLSDALFKPSNAPEPPSPQIPRPVREQPPRSSSNSELELKSSKVGLSSSVDSSQRLNKHQRNASDEGHKQKTYLGAYELLLKDEDLFWKRARARETQWDCNLRTLKPVTKMRIFLVRHGTETDYY